MKETICLVLLLGFVFCQDGIPVNVENVIYLLNLTVPQSSTITIGNDYGICELKGNLL
jgi:hypothetical protein